MKSLIIISLFISAFAFAEDVFKPNATVASRYMSADDAKYYLRLINKSVNGDESHVGGEIPKGSRILDFRPVQEKAGSSSAINTGELFFETPKGAVYYTTLGTFNNYTNPSYGFDWFRYDRSALVSVLRKNLGAFVRVNPETFLDETIALRMMNHEETLKVSTPDSIQAADAIVREFNRQKKKLTQILDVELDGYWPEQPASGYGKDLYVRVIGRSVSGRYELWTFALDSNFNYDEWLSKPMVIRIPYTFNKDIFLKSANKITEYRRST